MSKKFQTQPHAPKAPKAPKKGQSTLNPPSVAASGEAGSASSSEAGSPSGDSACAAEPGVVSSPSTLTEAAGPVTQAAGMNPTAQPDAPARSTNMQTITLTKSKSPIKSTRIVLFGGPLKTVQFLATAFPKGPDGKPVVPETITVSGDFIDPATARVAREKETPEQRKARLAALPKLTLAEKVAKAEERATKLREKLAAAAAKAAQPATGEQPAAEQPAAPSA